MKIAISNIAWNKEEDGEVLILLKKYEMPSIEIAPTMIWKEPTIETAETIKKYRKFWNDEGIAIISVQSLLFGHPDLRIFEDKDIRHDTLVYIKKMIQVCAQLGVKDIIFGSPANRDSGNIEFSKAVDIAAEFFYKVGESAKRFGIFFCIEPIPNEYGTNFINNTEEGIQLVEKVNHPNFRLHLDSGTLTVNKEDYKTSISNAMPYLQHFHISERDLKPIGSADVDHKTIAKILNGLHFDKWLSIEMRRKGSGSNEKVIEQTLKFVSEVYQ